MRTPIESLAESVTRLDRRIGAIALNALAGRRDLADQFRYECQADLAAMRRAFVQIEAACVGPIEEGGAK